jgi:putative transposase
MPRKPRQSSFSGYYHFINRGVNKKKIFHRDEDFSFYKGLLKEYKEKFSVQIIHYCLMSNHTHMVVRCDEIGSLSRFAHFLQRRYAYYYCKAYRWAEQVFRSRYMSIPIESDAYLLECGRYIERNPLDAGLVQGPDDYKQSSYAFYAHGAPDELVTEAPLYEDLGKSPQERRLVYRFHVLHNRGYEIEKSKAIKKLTGLDIKTQPVPF